MLVALYLIEGVAAASQLILTTIVSERLGLRLRRAAFNSALNQEVPFLSSMHARAACTCRMHVPHARAPLCPPTLQVCPKPVVRGACVGWTSADTPHMLRSCISRTVGIWT